MTDYKMPESHCPYCGALHNGADDADGYFGGDGAPPNEGDITICIKCASPLILDAELKLRTPTVAELKDIYDMPDVCDAIFALTVLHIKENKND